MSDETVRFGVLCSMYQAILRDRTSAKKRKRFRTFLDKVYTSRDYFSAVRLILPSLDRERGTYGLKESTLAVCLVDALGIARDSEDALRLVNWRKGGSRAGANAGNFALVASEVLQRRQGLASGEMTIKELNDLLDQLASKESRAEKTSVLSELIKRTNALEMKWIIMIILKDLKLGISERSIFHEFHPDAEDFFNVTCDLKLVCEKLNDRSQRHKRQDITVGKPVRPQLAMRVSDAATAWKKLHGKQVVIECKFDGDRIQIHKNGKEIHYFSRNFFDHLEYGHAMSNIMVENILADRCILDGEMLVWDTSRNRFAEFGSNQEIAKAAKEGLDSDRQLCYVAFDILYVGDSSVIHQSLTERHELLRKFVKPLKGRLEILVPDGLNAQRSPGEPCWSTVAYNVEDVEKFFKETIENRDEGVVLKDLGSKWEPGDRSGKWLKLKPDYVHSGSDLDVLIIGGYFGSGRHGGEVAQFLMGLAEPSAPDMYPKRFISFCRVGTGLSDDELDALVTKLKPFFRSVVLHFLEDCSCKSTRAGEGLWKNEHPKKAPCFYEVTNNSKERPDVWIDSPDKSIILSITSDIRTIKSEVFAAPYSLRFPRIQRVRYDKPWHECLDIQSFVDLVNSSNGNTHRHTNHGGIQVYQSKKVRSSRRGEKKSAVVVPTHFMQTDVSDVKEETFIFSNMMFYIVNVPVSYSVDYFHKLVAENGGTFSMNLNDSVTHCIAAEKKGIKYRAAMRYGDIIHYSWVLDCCSQKHLLHLQPKYFLFLSDSSKNKFQEEIDAFSDYYYWDIDITDIKQMFSNIQGSEDLKVIDYYKKKYCPMEKWLLFQDCCIYFCHPLESINDEQKLISELSLRRVKLEATIGGGEVSNNLSRATHLVSYSTMESDADFGRIYESFPSAERRILRNKQLHVVRHQWMEDSLGRGKKLAEDPYNVRPAKFEDLFVEQRALDLEDPATSGVVDNKGSLLNPDRDKQRRRGRPACTNVKRGSTATKPVQRKRARIGNRAAKIDTNVSDDTESSEEHGRREEIRSSKDSHPIQEFTMEEKVELSKKQKRLEDESKELETLDEGDENNGFGDNKRYKGLAKAKEIEGLESGSTEKLVVMIDPVQAMLLDMIPSLSQTKAEAGKSTIEDKKPVKEVKEPDPNPVKKKKVSYKDVANDLLKD